MILDVRAATRSFRKPLSRAPGRVVGPVDLQVAPGERVALTGPNGSGKSTLLRCIAGTIMTSSGSITVGGHAAGTRAARHLTGVSFSQERSFYLRLTGFQNLLTFARLRDATSGARRLVEEVVAELGLETLAQRRVDQCSMGMVQQLAIARALLGEPPLLLLDEPTRSLDDEAIARMWVALDARPGCAVIIATHHAEDVDRCERHLAFASL